MARARSPDSIEAEKLYKEGMLLVEIAKKLGKPEGTVRRWKSTQNWDGIGNSKGKKKENERSDKKANVRKPKGAPKGNKNAEGAGAPVGNQNALKHGGYAAVYWDVLTEEEKEMIDGAPTDEEALLIEQIQLFAVRERRLMQAINKYTSAKGGQYVSGVVSFEDKRKFEDKEEEEAYKAAVMKKVKSGDRLPGQQRSIQTNTAAAIDLVTRLEKELTGVQSKKTKAIETLTRLHLEKQKLDGESKGNEVVRAWAEKVKAMRGGGHG